MRRIALSVLLSGCCAHQALSLSSEYITAHEEGHCVEWGISKERWVYHKFDYEFCRKGTGCFDVVGCAMTDGKVCHIYSGKE